MWWPTSRIASSAWGSVGTRAYLLLMFGNGDSDPLFLQVKEAIVPMHAR
jgi:hypothetical protein